MTDSAWQRRIAAGKSVVSGRQNGSAATGSRKAKLPEDVKRYAEARKSGQRLLASMERYLLTVEDERGNDNLLHVSDLVKDKDWCPRMLYYRVNGVRPPVVPVRFQLQNVYDYGSETHLKFQRRWRNMGVLWGRWFCKSCEGTWLGMPPQECPLCAASPWAIRYREVPLADPDIMLVGNADGEIRDAQGNILVEVKTVSEGTIRIEMPNLYNAYLRTVTLEDGKTEKHLDIKSLWKDLRRPMPSHRRQGQTYVHLREKVLNEPPVEGIVFLYESKQSQGLKEFEVEPDAKVAEEVIGRAKDITFAVERGDPPRCPEGRDGCKICKPYEEEVRRGRSTPAQASGATQGAPDVPNGRVPSMSSAKRPVFSGTSRV